MKYSLKQLIGRTYNNSKDYKRGIPINGSKTVSLIKKKIIKGHIIHSQETKNSSSTAQHSRVFFPAQRMYEFYELILYFYFNWDSLTSKSTKNSLIPQTHIYRHTQAHSHLHTLSFFREVKVRKLKICIFGMEKALQCWHQQAWNVLDPGIVWKLWTDSRTDGPYSPHVAKHTNANLRDALPLPCLSLLGWFCYIKGYCLLGPPCNQLLKSMAKKAVWDTIMREVFA